MEEESLIDIANKHDLSTMERVLLAYDLVFENYCNYDKNYNYNREFINYLADLNIRSYPFLVKSVDDSSHHRFAIYIKDCKYNLDGIYFFDLINAGYEGFEFYNYFGKLKLFFDEFDRDNNIKEEYIGDFSNIVDLFYDIAQFDSYDEVPKNFIDSINHVSEIVDGKSLNLPYNNYNLDMDYYDIFKKINNYDLKLYNDMYFEDIIKMVLNISKVKYEEGITNYFDIDAIRYTLSYSNWDFNPKGKYELYRKKDYNKQLDMANIRNNYDYNRKHKDLLKIARWNTIDKIFDDYINQDIYLKKVNNNSKRFIKTKKCN